MSLPGGHEVNFFVLFVAFVRNLTFISEHERATRSLTKATKGTKSLARAAGTIGKVNGELPYSSKYSLPSSKVSRLPSANLFHPVLQCRQQLKK
jgi:hypothetical protein